MFLTGDQTLVLEQNLAGLRLAIIAVSAVELPVLKDNLALIGAEILGALPGTFQMVECGRFNQKGSPGMKSKEEKHGQTLTALFTAARAARAHAHAPYSRFKVGAAILTPSGQIYAGCNVENAAYPVGTCAEAGAIAAMVAGGDTRIAAVMIVGDGEALVTPCGACRQRIREFAGPDVPVHIAAKASPFPPSCPMPLDLTIWQSNQPPEIPERIMPERYKIAGISQPE